MADKTLVAWAFAENMVTITVCGSVIAGLYYMGAGLHSLWALVMMLNLNSVKTVRSYGKCEACDDKSDD